MFYNGFPDFTWRFQQKKIAIVPKENVKSEMRFPFRYFYYELFIISRVISIVET